MLHMKMHTSALWICSQSFRKMSAARTELEAGGYGGGRGPLGNQSVLLWSLIKTCFSKPSIMLGIEGRKMNETQALPSS